jgi:hypothetical protein
MTENRERSAKQNPGLPIASLGFRFHSSELTQQQTGFPANAFRGDAEFFKSAVLDLPHAFFADAKKMTDLAEAVSAVAGQAEAEVEYATFARTKIVHQEVEGFLSFGVLPERLALVIRHRFGEFEIAVVIENGIQRYRGSGRGLQVSQVFETAARARS